MDRRFAGILFITALCLVALSSRAAAGQSTAADQKHRLAIEQAVQAGQIERAIASYDELTGNGASPALPLLRIIAIGAASALASESNYTASATGCAAALRLDSQLPRCRQRLERMALEGDTAEERATAFYALLGAGLNLFPQNTGVVQASLTKTLRLKLAQDAIELPVEDRLWMLQPLFEDADIATQYQALLVSADLPGDAVLAALRTVTPIGPARSALLVALARHGDAASLAQGIETYETLGGYEKVQIAIALADASDARGVALLQAAQAGLTDLERIAAARALWRLQPADARAILLRALQSGGPAVQPAALRAAELMAMGADAAVYRRLTDSNAEVRALAVRAVCRAVSASQAPVDRSPR